MSEYDFEITQGPDFALLWIYLKQGQMIHVEPSAMATMDNTIDMKAGLKGGLLKSVGRAFGGESLIINTFTASSPGEISLAPGPGSPGLFLFFIELSQI